MDIDAQLIASFATSNKKVLAGYIRQKIVGAGAKAYLDSLGKDGIEALDREAAGLLLDLACALLSRLHPDIAIQPEVILASLSEDVRQSIRLPRSESYYAVLGEIAKD